MEINERDFTTVEEYNGYTLGLELMEDSDGFDKMNYSVFKYVKNNVYEHLGQQFVLKMYERVVSLSGFTYNSKGVREKFKEIVDGFSTSG